MSDMQEGTAFPLRVERFGDGGWFFVTCDDIPGLSIFGPAIDDLFDQLRVAATELLRDRGHEIARLSVEPILEAPGRNAWSHVESFELRTAA